MAFKYSQTVLNCLNGTTPFQVYTFVDIMVESPGVSNLYYTTYPSNIQITNASGTPNIWYIADLLKGVSTPPRTGSVTQEVQRIEIAQGLGIGWEDDTLDIIPALGNSFHNKKILFRTLIELDIDNTDVLTNESIISTDGIIKGISRSVKEDSVIIEFSNSFGKLAQVNELRTTPGSVKRRNPSDTSFDRAHLEAKFVMQDWGGDPND